MLTYAQFISDYSEFATIDEITFNSLYRRSLLVGSKFLGVDDVSDRITVQGLFLAHTIELRDRKASGQIAAVKSVKSRNDQITYAVSDNTTDLEQTSYGQLLCYYLENSYTGGFLV